MNTSKILLSASCAFALALTAAAPSDAQQQQQQMPRGPITTPIGSHPSDVLFSKIAVSDVYKSFEFYTKVIGLKRAMTLSQKEPLPPVEPDPTTWPGEIGFNFSGSFADSFFDITPARGVALPRELTDKIIIGLKVPDARALIKRVKDAGYEVVREAPPVGPGELTVGFVHDPDGYRLEIMQAATYPKGKR